MSAKTRAEKFEDEKRRIVESCFAKQDEDGSLLESYITHVRIVEDAAYPSTPAPPESPPENKKPRIIIVAVRKSGRVRMHKARENNNGSFSIGKTWVLDDLSAIQSFTGPASLKREEEQQRQWAGGAGFVVTISKSYYWQAGTSKEKDFFIASLVKIYKKYTAGKAPELLGFDAREREQLLGPQAARGPTPDAVPREVPRDINTRDAAISPAAPPLRSPYLPVEEPRPSIDSRTGSLTGSVPSSLPSNGISAARGYGRDSSDGPKAPSDGRPSRDETWMAPRKPEFPKPDYVKSEYAKPEYAKPALPPPDHPKADLAKTEAPSESKESVTSPSSVDSRDREDEDHRPGLGPMIKQKSRRDIGAAFRKAATAYTAFRPRPGGAGEKLREEGLKEPDGMTAVVPAPSPLSRGVSQDGSVSGAKRISDATEPVPEVMVTGAMSPPPRPAHRPYSSRERNEASRPSTPRTSLPKAGIVARTPPPAAAAAAAIQQRKKAQAEETARYVAHLGIDPHLLGDKATDIDWILSDFGCSGGDVKSGREGTGGKEGEMRGSPSRRPTPQSGSTAFPAPLASRLKKPEELEAELKRELGRVEAGSWLGLASASAASSSSPSRQSSSQAPQQFEEKDERVAVVERLLDQAMAECDELQGLLTLYSVELSTLNDDISYIEAQSGGLQVQTANQKLLQLELQTRLHSLNVPR
ncbi:MAG: hypothetical protein M1838_003845 [Thelocarpon superellum]|nr:MAG: hypothetical protein M1838_003845 [Thelocarpon superellum]